MTWNLSPAAGPWLATHLWDYYDFTRDIAFLKEHYGLEDVSGEGGHEIWESEYDRLMNDLDTRYSVRYIDMMNEIDKIRSEGK